MLVLSVSENNYCGVFVCWPCPRRRDLREQLLLGVEDSAPPGHKMRFGKFREPQKHGMVEVGKRT